MSDGGRISGARTPILVVTNLVLADASPYSVVVSNTSGTLTSRAALLTVTGPALIPAAAPAGSIGFYFPTVVGASYVLEQKATLDAPTWTPVETLPGTGGMLQFTNRTSGGSSFYRLRIQ